MPNHTQSFVKSEYFGDDVDVDDIIKQEPFDDSIVDEERYESQDQHSFEDNSTNGEYEDVPSTSRSNEKRSPRIAARHYNQASGKRSHATRQQIAILSAFMEKNPEVAKSYNPATICGGMTQRQQWEQLALSLNSNGPPIKSITEWKRVWTLRKYSTKKKLTHNKNSIKKAGGRPLNLKPLDETDVAIVNACGMAASVSGIVGALAFGSCSKENKEHQDPAPEQIVEDMPETPETVSESILHETSTTKRASQRKEKEEDILNKQLALQEHFFLSQIQSSKKTNETLGEIRDAIKELCQARIKEVEAANCLKKEELDVRRMELEVAKVANDIKLKEINSQFSASKGPSVEQEHQIDGNEETNGESTDFEDKEGIRRVVDLEKGNISPSAITQRSLIDKPNSARPLNYIKDIPEKERTAEQQISKLHWAKYILEKTVNPKSGEVGENIQALRRLKLQSYGELLKEKIIVAVIDGSTPDGAITFDRWTLVECELSVAFLKDMKENHGQPPRICDGGWDKNSIKLMACEDERSCDLFKIAIDKLGEVWPGAKLEVVVRNKTPNRLKALAWVPKKPCTPYEILQIIKFSNPQLSTHDWEVVKLFEHRGACRGAIIVISRESLAPLAKTEGIIHFGYRSITLRVYKEDEKETDTKKCTQSNSLDVTLDSKAVFAVKLENRNKDEFLSSSRFNVKT